MKGLQKSGATLWTSFLDVVGVQSLLLGAVLSLYLFKNDTVV